MIFVEEDHDQVLNAYGLLISLRTVGADMPIILLKDNTTASSMSTSGLPPTGIKAKPVGDRFTTLLQKPFTKRDICEIIRSVVLSSTLVFQERFDDLEINDSSNASVCVTEIDDDIYHK